jgi:hypothetical protein
MLLEVGFEGRCFDAPLSNTREQFRVFKRSTPKQIKGTRNPNFGPVFHATDPTKPEETPITVDKIAFHVENLVRNCFIIRHPNIGETLNVRHYRS